MLDRDEILEYLERWPTIWLDMSDGRRYSCDAGETWHDRLYDAIETAAEKRYANTRQKEQK